MATNVQRLPFPQRKAGREAGFFGRLQGAQGAICFSPGKSSRHSPPPPSLDPGRGGGTHPSEGARGREASAARRPQGLRPVLPSTCLRGREEAEKVSKGVGREGEGEGRGLSRSPSCLSL